MANQHDGDIDSITEGNHSENVWEYKYNKVDNKMNDNVLMNDTDSFKAALRKQENSNNDDDKGGYCKENERVPMSDWDHSNMSYHGMKRQISGTSFWNRKRKFKYCNFLLAFFLTICIGMIIYLTTSLTHLSSELQEMKDSVDTHKYVIGSHEAEVQRIQNLHIEVVKIPKLEAELQNLKTELTKIGQIEKEVQKIGDIENEIKKIKTLSDELQEIKKLVPKINKIEEIEREVSKIKQLEIVVQQMKGLEKEVAKIAILETELRRIPRLETEVNKISALKNSLDNMSVRLENLADAIRRRREASINKDKKKDVVFPGKKNEPNSGQILCYSAELLLITFLTLFYIKCVNI